MYRGIIMNKPYIVSVMASQLGIQNLNIWVGRIAKLFGLKIAVHYIKRGSSRPSKYTLYHDLRVLIRFIGFDHSRLPFILRQAKDPDLLFLYTLLYRILIWKYHSPPHCNILMPSKLGPFVLYFSVLFYKLRTLLCTLIDKPSLSAKIFNMGIAHFCIAMHPALCKYHFRV